MEQTAESNRTLLESVRQRQQEMKITSRLSASIASVVDWAQPPRKPTNQSASRSLALALAIVVRIKEEYDSIEEDEIQEIDRR